MKSKSIFYVSFWGTVIFVAFLYCFFLRWNIVRSTIINTSIDSNEIDQMVFAIDSAEKDRMEMTGPGTAVTGAGNGYYVIRGWAGFVNQTTGGFDTEILLQEEGADSRYIKLQTDMEQRKDLENYDDTDVSFANGGFVAKISEKKLKTNSTYKILIWYKNDDHNCLINTGKILEVN